jgi:hypothetical protein
MQNVAATTTIVNDTGLVSAEQIPAFRAYLVESGLRVRDSGAGQFFHVQVPGGTRWLPIERGRAGAPVTPQLLRSYVDGFLRTPLNTAVGQVRAERQAAERAVARAALDLPRECAPAPEHQPLHEQRKAFRESLKTTTAQLVSTQGVSLKSTGDAQYLSDLRDDFALHAPIPPLGKHPTEQELEQHVIRRWEYADLMIKHRTTQAGD